MTSYAVQGRTITLPVEVRRATTWAAQFLVPTERAQELVPKGLEVATLGNRALLSLAVARYIDGDLDSYNELAVAIAVRPHDATRKQGIFSGNVCVYVRHLPVDAAFTLEAGRTIWGYPKFMATIAIDEQPAHTTCTLSEEGRSILSLRIRNGGYLPIPQRPVPTYSDAQGELCRTSWRTGGHQRGRLGGATVTLGEGAIADELRSLGLPKRAVMTTSTRDMTATFGAPEPVSL